jgi:hypothetical protein
MTKLKKQEPIGYIGAKQRDGSFLRMETTRSFLEERIMRTVRQFIDGMSNEKCNELAAKYTGIDGSQIRLQLNFDEITMSGKMEIISPHPNADTPVKDPYEQAKEFLAMTEKPPDPPKKSRGKPT